MEDFQKIIVQMLKVQMDHQLKIRLSLRKITTRTTATVHSDWVDAILLAHLRASHSHLSRKRTPIPPTPHRSTAHFLQSGATGHRKQGAEVPKTRRNETKHLWNFFPAPQGPYHWRSPSRSLSNNHRHYLEGISCMKRLGNVRKASNNEVRAFVLVVWLIAFKI